MWGLIKKNISEGTPDLGLYQTPMLPAQGIHSLHFQMVAGHRVVTLCWKTVGEKHRWFLVGRLLCLHQVAVLVVFFFFLYVLSWCSMSWLWFQGASVSDDFTFVADPSPKKHLSLLGSPKTSWDGPLCLMIHAAPGSEDSGTAEVLDVSKSTRSIWKSKDVR